MKKIISILLFLALFLGITTTVFAMTKAEKQAALDRLQARMTALTAKMTELVNLIAQVKNQPSITVTSPNGGESWKIGETKNITWTSTGVINVTLSLVDASVGASSLTMPTIIAISVPASQGSYSWTIPSTITAGNYKIKVTENVGYNVMNRALVSDLSNNYFTITAIQTACSSNWVCGEWGPCINNVKTKNCTDTNKCATPTINTQPTTQNCNSACKTCSQLNKACGNAPDGCGNALYCGICPNGQVCYKGACTLSVTGTTNLTDLGIRQFYGNHFYGYHKVGSTDLKLCGGQSDTRTYTIPYVNDLYLNNGSSGYTWLFIEDIRNEKSFDFPVAKQIEVYLDSTFVKTVYLTNTTFMNGPVVELNADPKKSHTITLKNPDTNSNNCLIVGDLFLRWVSPEVDSNKLPRNVDTTLIHASEKNLVSNIDLKQGQTYNFKLKFPFDTNKDPDMSYAGYVFVTARSKNRAYVNGLQRLNFWINGKEMYIDSINNQGYPQTFNFPLNVMEFDWATGRGVSTSPNEVYDLSIKAVDQNDVIIDNIKVFWSAIPKQ